jgi:hypothetical protein
MTLARASALALAGALALALRAWHQNLRNGRCEFAGDALHRRRKLCSNRRGKQSTLVGLSCGLSRAHVAAGGGVADMLPREAGRAKSAFPQRAQYSIQAKSQKLSHMMQHSQASPEATTVKVRFTLGPSTDLRHIQLAPVATYSCFVGISRSMWAAGARGQAQAPCYH